MMDIGTFPFVKARWFTPLSTRVIDLWVIHSAESSEGLLTAENLGAYFKDPIDAKWNRVKASPHLSFDADSCVRSVHDKDIAYAAPGANHNGIQVEHGGRAAQTKEQWLDWYGINMLNLSSRVCAMYCLAYNWPVVFRNATDILAGGHRRRGITTHWEVTKAFKQGDHWDPGAGFPIEWYVNQVHYHITTLAPPEVVAMRIPNLTVPKRSPGGAIFLAGADGGVFVFGGGFAGSMSGKPMNAPVVDIEPWSNQGYWLIGADGGIFTFGDAPRVLPYNPDGPLGLPDEYARGERAVRGGVLSIDRKVLTLVTDDLRLYDLTVGS